MADLEPSTTPTAGAAEESDAVTDTPDSAPMTSAQAEEILAELKTIKQNLLWVLLIGGFFAARSFFFHY